MSPECFNPRFSHELSYSNFALPDAGYRLLALVRFWNIVQYFYPNRDISAGDPASAREYWDSALEEFIAPVMLAQDQASYAKAMMRFITRINDTHANLWSSLSFRPPVGACSLPVDIRFIEGRPLVVRVTSTAEQQLLPGDIIEQLDGAPVASLIEEWRPFYADSNEAARLRDIGLNMTRGSCGPADAVVNRGDQTIIIHTNRIAQALIDSSATSTHDRPGATFQRLSPEVAYLKLSSVKAADAAEYVRNAAGTKGLIIDIRNYPSEFVVFALGSLLVSEPTPFARFMNGDPSNPGAFYWSGAAGAYASRTALYGEDRYPRGRSDAEPGRVHDDGFSHGPERRRYRQHNGGRRRQRVHRTPSGGLSSYISGIGVFYPDRRPTQRVGIIPDIVVKPTIAGMRAGRDELVEAAIRVILSNTHQSGRHRAR